VVYLTHSVEIAPALLALPDSLHTLLRAEAQRAVITPVFADARDRASIFSRQAERAQQTAPRFVVNLDTPVTSSGANNLENVLKRLVLSTLREIRIRVYNAGVTLGYRFARKSNARAAPASSGVIRAASLIVARVQITCGNCPRGSLPGERLGEQVPDGFRARRAGLRLRRYPGVNLSTHVFSEATRRRRSRGGFRRYRGRESRRFSQRPRTASRRGEEGDSRRAADNITPIRAVRAR
jgi:hypothetical protein